MKYWLINLFLALIFAPVLGGIINKVKAFFAGRRGPRLLQGWYDIIKLLKKGTVYSKTATFWFKAAPPAALAAVILSLLLLPGGKVDSPFAFTGDALLFLYLLGSARMLTVLAALDTGSSFEGMGAARELHFAIVTELTMILLFGFLALNNAAFSISRMFVAVDDPAVQLLLAAGVYIVLLTECCRVPVDDPDTHLELTMIHEAMILDNSGPDLALIHYAAGLKMWIFAVLLTLLVIPFDTPVWSWPLITLAGAAVTAVLVGITESMMARYRFLKVPQMLFGGTALMLTAIALRIYRGI